MSHSYQMLIRRLIHHSGVCSVICTSRYHLQNCRRQPRDSQPAYIAAELVSIDSTNFSCIFIAVSPVACNSIQMMMSARRTGGYGYTVYRMHKCQYDNKTPMYSKFAAKAIPLMSNENVTASRGHANSAHKYGCVMHVIQSFDLFLCSFRRGALFTTSHTTTD